MQGATLVAFLQGEICTVYFIPPTVLKLWKENRAWFLFSFESQKMQNGFVRFFFFFTDALYLAGMR